MLHEFLDSNREELISRCRVRVAKRIAPRATERELEYGIPVFLSQITAILREQRSGANAQRPDRPSKTSNPSIADDIGRTASSHGSELLLKGFTVDQVVHDYGDLCQAVTELATERNVPI